MLSDGDLRALLERTSTIAVVGIVSGPARERAEQARLIYVENRRLGAEVARLGIPKR